MTVLPICGAGRLTYHIPDIPVTPNISMSRHGPGLEPFPVDPIAAADVSCAMVVARAGNLFVP
jgi:hypothetical protein